MSEKSEALRLADELERPAVSRFRLYTSAALLRSLHAENERIGPLAERVLELKAQRDALLEALRALVQNEGLDPYSYLDKGIGTATAAGQRWLNARVAIKQAEGGQ